MKTNLLLMALLAISTLGCESKLDELFPPPPPVQLPAETQRGANTFGCVLNGQTWEAAQHGSIRPFLYASPDAIYSRGTLHLQASRRQQVESPAFTLSLYVSQLRGPGLYILSRRPACGGGFYAYAEVGFEDGYRYYSTDSVRIGSLIVTALDTVSARKFIAGRFVLTARPPGARCRPPGCRQSSPLPKAALMSS